ncbi:dethiobiotin synthetase [Micrococcus cohnii]|uniref:Dethiobiotin synthetase n=1 Tax=Micrococcus cohnii TaxID=993416 RepID=A0A7W7GQI7_9MICC|nr:dethiobiotin synthase [Micrococcus cohnii]MBB4736405.1 dethiobiotin synthetase [Micrococcus cohnii]
MSARIQVITGTDTDVGKTWATAASAAQALAAGERVHVDKPAQTGVQPGEDGDVDVVRGLVADAVRAGRLAGEVCERLTVSEGARLGPAMAPVDAVAQSAEAGERAPALPALREQLDRWVGLASDTDLLLIEGAGGITVDWTSQGEGPVDAVLALRRAGYAAELVVVARPGLGTQNHTRLTVEHAAGRGVVPGRIVVSGVAEEPDAVERANLRFLARLAEAHGARFETVPWGGTAMRRG